MLYHSAVKSAPSELDIGTARYRVENIYLSDLNGDAALDEVERHLRTHDWEPKDRIKLALALCMDVKEREHAFARVLDLVPKVKDETERDLVIAAILSLADKNLSETERIRLQKELRNMSKII